MWLKMKEEPQDEDDVWMAGLMIIFIEMEMMKIG